jgi:hypothetical protein
MIEIETSKTNVTWMRMKSRVTTAAAAIALLLSTANYAQENDVRSDSFIGTYLTTCMQHLNNLEELRSKLIENQIPKFPPAQAKHFLMGFDGDAWPRLQDGVLGNLVVSLPTGKNLCAVTARKANPSDVVGQFIKLFAIAPVPLISERKRDTYQDTTNGRTHTITYAWGMPNVNRKMWFVLTTTASESASLQALATASIGEP